MTKRTAAHVDLAQRLLASCHEATGPGGAAALYAILSSRLTPLVGATGFRAVFGRSLKLTRSEFPALVDGVPGIEVGYETAPGQERVLQWLGELEPARGSEVAAAVYGTLLALLGSLVGERLVWQVIRRGFPTIEQGTTEETK